MAKAIPEVETLREALAQSRTRPIQYKGFIYLNGVPKIRWK